MSSKRRMVETMPRVDGYLVKNIIVASKRSARTYDTNAMVLQGKIGPAPFWFAEDEMEAVPKVSQVPGVPHVIDVQSFSSLFRVRSKDSTASLG
jgi:hypothetical protein